MFHLQFACHVAKLILTHFHVVAFYLSAHIVNLPFNLKELPREETVRDMSISHVLCDTT